MFKKIFANQKLLLICILMLAFVLRFYSLGSLPALNADEVAIGYNVYSLLETSKDEHGNSWPVHFQSFNDYKPGFFFYVVMPFVKLFGLNIWAVRIPGALAGVLTVFVLYRLVKRLFDNENLALMSALFLAISPWHIHFSRGGWEVNFACFLMASGVYFFLEAVSRKLNLKYLLLSVLFFVLSLYTYHSARIIVPLLGLGLFVIYFKNIWPNIKKLVIGVIVGIILLLPLALDLTKPAITSRVSGVGLFADSGPIARVEEQRGEHTSYQSKFAKLTHNKLVNYGLAFFYNWSQHYYGEFLFLSGDEIQRNRVPETGQLYLVEVVFILVGLTAIVKSISAKKNTKGWLFVIYWFLVAPSAAALTFQSPHALRSQNMVLPITIISAFGFFSIGRWLRVVLKNKKILSLSYAALVLILVWSFARYLHMYYVHLAKEYTFSSQYGLEELVDYVSKNQDKYNKVMITDRYDQPYILFLFYQKYSPQKFQKDHSLTSRDGYGFSTVRKFDKYEFTSIDFDQMRPENPNSLIIGTDEEIPDEANIVKNIYGSNGHLYFQIVVN